MYGTSPYDHGFGTLWTDVSVRTREGYSTSVTDYHRHDFYEINLILSGNVKILLADRSEEGCGSRIVLTRPGTLHYIACKPDTLYKRQYLCFSEEFVAGYFPEWATLSRIFGKNGQTSTLTEADTARLSTLIDRIGDESDPFRRKLLVYYFLSLLSDPITKSPAPSEPVPAYVVEALAYLEAHYAEKIVAEALAKHLHIGRTTLLTAFRHYTDHTVGEYLTHCRLRHAVRLLKGGETLESTALQCGFSDTSGLVRMFRRVYGMTPKAYAEQS